MYPKTYQRGFTLLLATLVGSLTLAIGVSIVTIVRKSVTLSSIGRESQFAFYAADTGAECALYWDFRHDFASTTLPITPIDCGGDDQITVSHSSFAQYPIEFEFQFEPHGRCVEVIVIKNSSAPQTTIHADGYSTDCAQISTNTRTLQRSVELRY